MNIKNHLTKIAAQNGLAAESLQFPDCEINPQSIKPHSIRLFGAC
jgi:hypothetical protein